MFRSQSAKMLHLFGVIGSLLVLTVESRIGNSSQLSFCNETLECLLFDQICKTDQIEVRHYNSVKWVTTEVTSTSIQLAAATTFWRLFQYTTDNQIKIASPVIMKLQNVEQETKVYSMSFLLPTEHQLDPPTPTNESVKITETPDMNVYVKSFGGWLTSESDKDQASSLSSTLKSLAAQHNKEYHYAAAYNNPITLLDRHNEVWFVAEGETACSISETLD